MGIINPVLNLPLSLQHYLPAAADKTQNQQNSQQAADQYTGAPKAYCAPKMKIQIENNYKAAGNAGDQMKQY